MKPLTPAEAKRRFEQALHDMHAAMDDRFAGRGKPRDFRCEPSNYETHGSAIQAVRSAAEAWARASAAEGEARMWRTLRPHPEDAQP